MKLCLAALATAIATSLCCHAQKIKVTPGIYHINNKYTGADEVYELNQDSTFRFFHFGLKGGYTNSGSYRLKNDTLLLTYTAVPKENLTCIVNVQESLSPSGKVEVSIRQSGNGRGVGRAAIFLKNLRTGMSTDVHGRATLTLDPLKGDTLIAIVDGYSILEYPLQAYSDLFVKIETNFLLHDHPGGNDSIRVSSANKRSLELMRGAEAFAFQRITERDFAKLFESYSKPLSQSKTTERRKTNRRQ